MRGGGNRVTPNATKALSQAGPDKRTTANAARADAVERAKMVSSDTSLIAF